MDNPIQFHVSQKLFKQLETTAQSTKRSAESHLIEALQNHLDYYQAFQTPLEQLKVQMPT